MPQDEQPGGHERRAIEPVYRPSDDGTIVVYAGDLLLAIGTDEQIVRGNLALSLSPRPEFSAQVVSSDWLAHVAGGPPVTVGLPPGAELDPPTSLVQSAQPEAAGSEAYVSTSINRVTAGELQLAERLLLHVSGPLSRHPLPSRETSSGEPTQPQLSWSLSGWQLCLAEAGGPTAVDDFTYVVEAIPPDLPLRLDGTERLCNQVFLLLSLIAGQEIGVAPVVGVDADGRVVWADWGAPRFRPEQSAWRWCPRRLVHQALPALATGLTSLTDDPALHQVADRAGRHLLAANGPEVLDVRIPVACTGLELLSWAVLQRHQWLTKDGLGKLPASSRVRLLLHWAAIPVELPNHFGALTARRGRLHPPDAGGPELIFEVRNSLVHPPKRIEEPEWPNRDELLQAWQLATGIWNLRCFGCLATRVNICLAFTWEVGSSIRKPCRGRRAPQRNLDDQRAGRSMAPGQGAVILASFQEALLGATGAHWLDHPPDLSCKDSIRQHPADNSLLSCKQQPGSESPWQLLMELIVSRATY